MPVSRVRQVDLVVQDLDQKEFLGYEEEAKQIEGEVTAIQGSRKTWFSSFVFNQ